MPPIGRPANPPREANWLKSTFGPTLQLSQSTKLQARQLQNGTFELTLDVQLQQYTVFALPAERAMICPFRQRSNVYFGAG